MMMQRTKTADETDCQMVSEGLDRKTSFGSHRNTLCISRFPKCSIVGKEPLSSGKQVQPMSVPRRDNLWIYILFGLG